MASTASRACRDRKEPEPGKNEPNQNPGFVKNRTEHEPGSKKNEQEPEPNTVKNRTEREPKCRGSYSVVLLLNEIVATATHFTVNEAFYFT